MPIQTALYRHYDEHDTLLYVGISLSAVQRLSEHMAGSRWHRFIARVDVQWLPSRETAEQAEEMAIRLEGPIFNIRHGNPVTRASTLRRVSEAADRAEAQAAAMRAQARATHPIGPDGFADAEAVVRAAWRDGLRVEIPSDGAQGRLCA